MSHALTGDSKPWTRFNVQTDGLPEEVGTCPRCWALVRVEVWRRHQEVCGVTVGHVEAARRFTAAAKGLKDALGSRPDARQYEPTNAPLCPHCLRAACPWLGAYRSNKEYPKPERCPHHELEHWAPNVAKWVAQRLPPRRVMTAPGTVRVNLNARVLVVPTESGAKMLGRGVPGRPISMQLWQLMDRMGRITMGTPAPFMGNDIHLDIQDGVVEWVDDE